MREYKFRGKRKDNGDWVHGYYLIVDNKHLIFPPNAHFDQIGYYSKKGCFGEILQEGTCWICEVDRESVGQFTGLKDKNDKEIYEGDITKDPDGNVFEVVWNKGATSFELQNKISHFLFVQRYIDMFEAIGNIHDNPELLSAEVGE